MCALMQEVLTRKAWNHQFIGTIITGNARYTNMHTTDCDIEICKIPLNYAINATYVSS